jgi:hypothetical protein
MLQQVYQHCAGGPKKKRTEKKKMRRTIVLPLLQAQSLPGDLPRIQGHEEALPFRSAQRTNTPRLWREPNVMGPTEDVHALLAKDWAELPLEGGSAHPVFAEDIVTDVGGAGLGQRILQCVRLVCLPLVADLVLHLRTCSPLQVVQLKLFCLGGRRRASRFQQLGG